MSMIGNILGQKMAPPAPMPVSPGVSADAEAARQAAGAAARSSMPSARAPTGDEYGKNLMAAKALR